MSRFGRWGACVLVMAAVASGCGSDSDEGGAESDASIEASDTTDTDSDTDGTEATEATGASAGSSPAAPAPTEGEFCETVPDAAAIEGAIGVAVKDPSSVGIPGSLITCSYLSEGSGGQDVSFSASYGRTIAMQTEYLKETLSVDVTPLEGADGFYDGEGDSVYYELDGNLYQVQALLPEGDNVAAAVSLLRLWLGV